MSIYQFAQFRFDESRGSLTAFKDDEINSNNTSGNNSKNNSEPQGSTTDINKSELSAGSPIQLRRKVANLLSYLITHRTRIISKDELLSELWLHGDYRENSLTQSIRELRAALGDNAKSPSFIKTYPQRGYQWIQIPTDILHDNTTNAEESNNSELTNSTLSIENEVSTESEQSPSNSSLPLASHMQNAESIVADNNRHEIDADSSHATNTVSIEPKKSAKKLYIAVSSIIALLVGLFFWFNYFEKMTSNNNQPHHQASGITSLLVLPFINATEKPSMGWLELGLADMLAIDLQRHDSMSTNQLHVTPPAVANALLLNAQLPWPTLPIHIRTLLREHNIEAAIFASVRLYKNQQVLDFQIIHAQDEIQQGSISYPSLPAALQSVSQQLLHLLNPKLTPPSKSKNDNPITSQALAQGMQALQQEGPQRARKYFQAVLLLEEDNYWASAYSARSSFALGQWQEAEKEFNSLPTTALADDPSLDAFIHYWLAEIAFRRGNTDAEELVNIALDKAERVSDAKQMARSYRLKGQIAWHQRDWAAHQMWSVKANNLFAVNNELNVEANKLFYLGSPSNSGLEKAPINDLQKNKASLLKALNFYQQLGNQTMIAASQFAIAQNYTFELATRATALQKTLTLYKQLQQPYELAQALNYAGFYHMQLHDGKTASRYFSQARDIAQTLGANALLEVSDFYLAFAMLDQGLDQSALGRHGKDEAKLKNAIDHLETFIANKPSPDLEGSALVFLGWANTELGHLDLALEQLNKAKVLNTELNMPITLGYSNYSIMRIHLERGNYQAVIAMANDEITTRLQAVYLARAYYEQGQSEMAINVLVKFKKNLAGLWQEKDALRLSQYQLNLSGTELNLGDEPKAHLVYCESDWQL
jgi:DNA-binding winged helix-turn-helix (wHTH) protein/tetratricopeptide (TPR) repeat protein